MTKTRFDFADAAIESLIDGNFQIGDRGPMLIADPVFLDLAAALDVPIPMIDTINDPERVFDMLQTIGQSNITTTCDVMGITAESRVNSMYTASGLRNFMCSNIALAVYTPNCP